MTKYETVQNSKDIQEILLQNAICQRKEITFAASGICMAPLIKGGDGISFRKVGIDELKWLDLIEFRENNMYISHRFIRTITKNGRSYLISKADMSLQYDDPISEDNFIGLITKIHKNSGILRLDTVAGKLRSYLNVFIGPLFSCMRAVLRKVLYEKENAFFLMLASGTDIYNPALTRAEELLSSGLNWDYMLEKIRLNFAAPTVLRNIINKGLNGNISEYALKSLRELSRRQVYNDAKAYSELKAVLSSFNLNKIKVIVIKGAYLGGEIYGDTFLRWMGDIDILAKIDDWPKIKDLLIGLGFETGDDDYDRWGLNYLDCRIAFFKDEVRLEIKFNIWQMEFPYFKNDLWLRSRNIILSGEKVSVPSIEDTLLIACVNLTRHNYSGLIWLCDIKEIIIKFQRKIDWRIFIERAKERDIDCMAYYALYYSSHLLNYNIPQVVLQELRPPSIKRALHDFFWDKKVILWQKEGRAERAKIAFEFAVLFFGGKASLKPAKLAKMVGYIGTVILPPRTHLKRDYGVNKDSSNIVLYYLLRPLRFAFMILDNAMALTFGRK